MDRRTFLKVTAGVGVAATVGAGQVRGQTAVRSFVLIAGAFGGGWLWTRVADRLRGAGHRVFTPSLTGLGDRAHLLSRNVNLETSIQDIIGVIQAEELSEVILVGSSFGGVQISGVADRTPDRIRHLAYVDAIVLQPGKSWIEGVPPAMAEGVRKAAQDSSGGLSIPIPPPANLSAQGLSEADVAWCRRRYTPQPLAIFESELNVKNPIGNNLPRTYVACLNPDFPGARPSRAWVKQQEGWTWIEMQTGHLPMVTSSRGADFGLDQDRCRVGSADRQPPICWAECRAQSMWHERFPIFRHAPCSRRSGERAPSAQ